VNTDSLSTAEKLVKNLQTLMIEQATMVNLGYGVDLIPEQTNTFTNYSHTNPDAVYIYWYWQFFSLEKTKATAVKYPYHLTVSAALSSSTTQYDNETSTITFTVTNGTAPVSGATVLVGISATYGGIFNITSTTLTTNSNGVAQFKYEVKDLNTLLETTNSTGAVVHVSSEDVNITGIAELKGSTSVGPGNATVELTLMPNKPVSTANYTTDYIVAGVVVAVVVVAGAAFVVMRKPKIKS